MAIRIERWCGAMSKLDGALGLMEDVEKLLHEAAARMDGTPEDDRIESLAQWAEELRGALLEERGRMEEAKRA